MLRRTIIFLVVLILLAGLSVAWYYQQKPKTIVTHKPMAIPVSVTKVKVLTIPREISSIGVLQAEQQITVTPELAGEIVGIYYTPGSFVREGKLLFQLDDHLYQAKLNASTMALRLAQSNYRRYQKLARIGAQSQQTLDQMRSQFLQAMEQVSLDETYLSQTKIIAPFSGFIGAKNISIGDYVKPGQPLTTLTDRSHLLVDYHLSEELLTAVKLGQTVKVKFHEGGKRTFNGNVVYISPIVDPSTQSFTVQADIPNVDNILSPGLFVHVIQSLGKARDALVIPQECIIPAVTGKKVFIIENGRARLINVKTGMTFNDQVEIIQGLSKGNLVVTTGQQQLTDGALVKVVRP